MQHLALALIPKCGMAVDGQPSVSLWSFHKAVVLVALEPSMDSNVASQL